LIFKDIYSRAMGVGMGCNMEFITGSAYSDWKVAGRCNHILEHCWQVYGWSCWVRPKLAGLSTRDMELERIERLALYTMVLRSSTWMSKSISSAHVRLLLS